MSTITPTQEKAISELVSRMHLPQGRGTKESACSIAAINLALTGELTDDIPDCMSPVIGRWIMTIQDRMSDEMRNSEGWKHLLPYAAGTGREKEAERLALIMDWMWSTALPLGQELADKLGYGKEWKAMCELRTADAASYAASASSAASYAADAYAAYASSAAASVASAADAAASVASAAASVADAADAASYASYAASAANWIKLDPCALLDKLINLDQNKES